MLVADALRLGGAILSVFPDMLAPQLVGRLLPEIGSNPNVKMLLNQCDKVGPDHCALLPFYHCLHTPGGPLKYSLEGHQFAVFDFCLTGDFRYIVSISNKFITWDLSTSDLTRDVNPGLEGIMQQLCISPDNRFAAAYTNNNQTVLLNMLTSEYVILENPLPNEENVAGVFLLNQHLFIHGTGNWCKFSMRGVLESRHASTVNAGQWPMLSVEFTDLEDYRFLYWSGSLDDPSMLLHTTRGKCELEPFYFHSAMVMTADKQTMFCCTDKGRFTVSEYTAMLGALSWTKVRTLPSSYNDEVEALLQLKLDKSELILLGTTANGFIVWLLGGERKRIDSVCINDWDMGKGERSECTNAIVLQLPHGIRNISTRMLRSNSVMLSNNRDFAVAGVRKNIYVWKLNNSELLKVLDAHFGRIISLEALTIGNWNSVITSSIDRTVKVWNINNIFEQEHVIDRHELQVESICISQLTGIAVTVTRGCVGVWDLQIGRLMAHLADSPLGAIVTHALITPDGKFIISSESGNILIWNRITGQVIFKEEQPGVRQLVFLEEGTKFLAISKPPVPVGQEAPTKTTATGIARIIPSGTNIYQFEYPLKNITGVSFKQGVITCDGQNVVALAADKGHRETVVVFNAKTGAPGPKIPLKVAGVKDVSFMVAMPNKANLVALVDAEKATVLDIKSKRALRTVPKWGGCCTRDGKFGLYAPSRGGLELIELKKGNTVRTFIPKVAEGVFTVICTFNKTDEYVLYYHSGKKTLRVFRTADARMIANFRVQAELSAVESTEDGRAIVLGTVDGCVSALAIADPDKPEMKEFLGGLPSRDEQWKKKLERQKATKRFRAAGSIAKLCIQMYENVTSTNESEGAKLEQPKEDEEGNVVPAQEN